MTIIVTVIASIFPDIILRELTGTVPTWFNLAKVIILIGVSIYFKINDELKPLAKYTIILAMIAGVQMLTISFVATSWYQSVFDANTFVGNFGGSILLKFIGTIPVIGLLIYLFKSPEEVYLTKGDLSIKAEKIGWLRIEGDKISWGKLSVISAFLIAFGTLLLTLLTVTGFAIPDNMDRLFTYLPLILLFALVNSFAEGVVYRSSILGSLKDVLPKEQVLLIAAGLFGMAHYYGAPSGVVGVIMSGVLGWYMCRSMYETKGFVSAWIIHFMQDAVIFATVVLLGGFS